MMAMCERGYLCRVCGEDVECISESDLYLRYVIGEIDPEVLHTTAERHLRCNPVLAQFIEHPKFKSVQVEGSFAKGSLDISYVQHRTELVSRGYARLLELEAQGGESDVTTYPLPEVLEKWQRLT